MANKENDRHGPATCTDDMNATTWPGDIYPGDMHRRHEPATYTGDKGDVTTIHARRHMANKENNLVGTILVCSGYCEGSNGTDALVDASHAHL